MYITKCHIFFQVAYIYIYTLCIRILFPYSLVLRRPPIPDWVEDLAWQPILGHVGGTGMFSVYL